MKYEKLDFNEEEIIKSLKDAGLEILTPDDPEFDKYPTLQEQMNALRNKMKMTSNLHDILTEINTCLTSSNTDAAKLNELCNKGIAILEALKK